MEKHSINIENREKITITEVKGIDTFDEEEVCVELSEGGMVLKGKRLHIHMLDLEDGTAVITGEISSLSYTRKKTGKSLIHRMMK